MHQNYEVIRLIRQNMDCHIIMDCVAGELLGEYIIRNPNITKEQFFSWIIQLVKEMESIEIAKGLSEYRFFNPFCVVLKEDSTIALLNLKAKSNQKRLDRLFENSVGKKFFPEDGTYNDIYSFGRTIQFILAKACLAPQLTKKEERRLQKIVSKCLAVNSRKFYQGFEEISSDILNFKKKSKKIKWVLLGGVTVILSLFLLRRWELEPQRVELRMYQEIEDYMQGISNKTEREMENLLREYQEEVKEPLSYKEKYCLIKAYSKIDTAYARGQVISLAENILNSTDWQKNENEIRTLLDKALKREEAR